jgi:hypothetical protein
MQSRARAIERPKTEKAAKGLEAEVRTLHDNLQQNIREDEAYAQFKEKGDFTLPALQRAWQEVANLGKPLTSRQLQQVHKIFRGVQSEIKKGNISRRSTTPSGRAIRQQLVKQGELLMTFTIRSENRRLSSVVNWRIAKQQPILKRIAKPLTINRRVAREKFLHLIL